MPPTSYGEMLHNQLDKDLLCVPQLIECSCGLKIVLVCLGDKEFCLRL